MHIHVGDGVDVLRREEADHLDLNQSWTDLDFTHSGVRRQRQSKTDSKGQTGYEGLTDCTCPGPLADPAREYSK